jgi:predicted trehalose synthase
MTGPDHYRKAEELTAHAHDYLGQGDGQDSAAVWAAVAQIHATLALAAASALGTAAAEGRAWADVAGTRFSQADS